MRDMLQKAATSREDASLTCFFRLVATGDVRGTCPTRKLQLFFNLTQMGPRKNTISYFGDPQRATAVGLGGILDDGEDGLLHGLCYPWDQDRLGITGPLDDVPG